MTFREYLNVKAINQTSLKEIAVCPYKYWYKKIGPDAKEEEPSASMNVGTALHSLVLEGERAWVIEPKFNKRTDKGKDDYKAWKEALPEDTVILTKKEEELVDGMAESILSNDDALELISPNEDVFKTENLILFDYDHEGQKVRAKSKLDLIKVSHGTFPDFHSVMTVVDIKTAQDASREGFRKAIANFKYHMQAAYYLTAAASATRIVGQYTQRFKFLVVEKKPPYAVAIYGLEDDALKQGFREIHHAMSIYCDYKDQTDPWPGYRMPDEGDVLLDLPVWARDVLYRPDLMI